MPERLRRAGIIVHSGRPEALRAARSLCRWLREHGVQTRSLEGELVDADDATGVHTFASELDLVLSVGGDGTLLRAAQLANQGGVPLLGVKVGRLGFLTEVDPSDAPALLSRILEGEIQIEERMAVEAVPLEGSSRQPQWALNEVIVEKRARHRLITLATSIGGGYVTTFSADGVIVATPTGSTAYSFSARGPIVSPRLPCLLLTPVTPHMVFDRSFVLAPDEEVTLQVLGEEPGLLSADGRPGLLIPVGARVRIRRAEHPARLVRRPGSPSFMALLREKFSLPGHPPEGRAATTAPPPTGYG